MLFSFHLCIIISEVLFSSEGVREVLVSSEEVRQFLFTSGRVIDVLFSSGVWHFSSVHRKSSCLQFRGREVLFSSEEEKFSSVQRKKSFQSRESKWNNRNTASDRMTGHISNNTKSTKEMDKDHLVSTSLISSGWYKSLSLMYFMTGSGTM